MKSIMLASAAMLSFAAVTGVATAQETPAPMSQPPAGPRHASRPCHDGPCCTRNCSGNPC